MRVRFWGTRGNVASPGSHTIELGGNTSCVEVELAPDSRIILDAGTGLIEYASSIVNRVLTESIAPGTHHLVLTHFHWDHLLGFPFFHPLHVRGTKVHVYSGFPVEQLERHVRALFDGTYSPLRSLDRTRAEVTFHQIPPEGLAIGEALVNCQPTDHSEDCFAIRIAAQGQSVAYATDHEARESLLNQRLLEFVGGADLLIHDAQWTAEEYQQSIGWGHSSIESAIENGCKAGVRRLCLSHHAPTHGDDFLRLYLSRYRRRHGLPAGAPEVAFAEEGASFEV